MQFIRHALGLDVANRQEIVEATNRQQADAREGLRTSVERFNKEIDRWADTITSQHRGDWRKK